MAKKIIKGDQLQAWIGVNGVWLNPKWATSHTLTITGNTVDVATKDHGFWGASEVGNLSWEVTAECLYSDNDFDKLFDFMVGSQKLDVVFAQVRNYDANGLTSVGGNVEKWEPAAQQRKGKCVITSLNANANTGENATFSITFTGSGPLTAVDYSVTETYLDVTYGVQALENANYKIYNTINGNDAVMSIVATADENTDSYVLDHTGYIPKEVVDAFGEDVNNITVRYYLSGNVIPSRMFQNVTLYSFDGTFTNDVRVGEYAFAGAEIVRGIGTITTSFGIHYGNHAFDNCTSLFLLNGTVQSTVSWLNGTYYGDYSFRNTELETVTHNQNPEPLEIGYGAFEGCAQLNDFKMSESVAVVGQDAFKGCDDITIHFYQQHAPTCSSNSFGTVGQQHFKLHYVTSVEAFLGDDEMAAYYPAATCDYQIV